MTHVFDESTRVKVVAKLETKVQDTVNSTGNIATIKEVLEYKWSTRSNEGHNFAFRNVKY